MNNKKMYDELIKILFKKAKGFYYTEEQEDYEKTHNKSNSSEKTLKNISFFENYDIPKTQNPQSDDTIIATNEKNH